jgi:hypothetical protein
MQPGSQDARGMEGLRRNPLTAPPNVGKVRFPAPTRKVRTMSYITKLLARVDAAINRDIDKAIAERPIPTAAMVLTGLSPVKLLDTYSSVKGQAELRKEAIEAEIRRLNGALDDTNVALAAIDAAIGVLVSAAPVDLSDEDLADFSGAELDPRFEAHPDQTSPMTVERERFLDTLGGHTSPARRLEEYAKQVANEIGGDERH